jgi:hypothetical protein
MRSLRLSLVGTVILMLEPDGTITKVLEGGIFHGAMPPMPEPVERPSE